MLPPRPHTWGTGFASRVGVGTGVDHARLGDCWVVRHTQIPTLRMVLKPIPTTANWVLELQWHQVPTGQPGLGY